MLRIRSVHLCFLRALYLLSQLFGLMAATGRWNVRRMQCSRYWRLHGYLVFLFVLCYSPFAFYISYTRTLFLRQHPLLLIVGFHRYALLLCTTLVTLYMHTTGQKCIIGWLNRLLWCRRHLLQLLPSSSTLTQSALELYTPAHLLTVYALIVSIICSSSHTIGRLYNDKMVELSWGYFWSVLFFYGCQLGLQLCLGLYLLAVLLISHLSHHCNLLLARILKDAAHIHETGLPGSLPRRGRLLEAQQHWLAHELWRLWRLQGRLMQLSRSLCSLHRIQLLAFVAFVPSECVSHAFFTYFVLYSRFWLRKYGASGHVQGYSMLCICAQFVQLFLLIIQVHRQRQIFESTRHILRKGALALPPGCSKKLIQTLHFYGVQLQLNERTFHLTACGLFELNNSLLFGIAQTILNYIMILIQFDKIINI